MAVASSTKMHKVCTKAIRQLIGIIATTSGWTAARAIASVWASVGGWLGTLQFCHTR
jgi:hypothetical protein